MSGTHMTVSHRLIATMAWWVEASLSHPRLFRWLLSPIARFPFLGKHLPVVPRCVLGATAFEAHRVDMVRGRIGIGGVDEALTGSKLIQLMHTVTAKRVGEAESARMLYELGEGTCRWELGEALRHGLWAAQSLVAFRNTGPSPGWRMVASRGQAHAPCPFGGFPLC